MLLSELHRAPDLEQLDELSLKQAAAAGIIGAAALLGTPRQELPKQPTPISKIVKTEAERAAELTGVVLNKYKVSKNAAWEIVSHAIKHEDKVFPKAEDILAIIGIESSFNPMAKSKLKHDPAVGLMQVRPKVWGLSKSSLITPEEQIKTGSKILKNYYVRTGGKKDAVHAYNVGITNFKQEKKLNPTYVANYEAERKLYEN
jgi:soluble lytic murein transglycosylase-like protein